MRGSAFGFGFSMLRVWVWAHAAREGLMLHVYAEGLMLHVRGSAFGFGFGKPCRSHEVLLLEKLLHLLLY